MRITNEYVYNPNALGNGNDPEIIWPAGAPDASSFFGIRRPGSIAIFQRAVAPNYSMVEQWVKGANANLASDWSCIAGLLICRLNVNDMVDGGAAVGTYDIPTLLPAGFYVTASSCKDVVGFAGDTSATLQIGTATTINQFCTGTWNVFATAAIPASVTTQGTPSGNRGGTAAVAVRLSITTAADFTPCKANGNGRLTAAVNYLV